MNKKYNRQRTIVHDEQEHKPDRDILQNIHKKLDDSPALNGGFDRLLYKIDGIEKSQGQIVEKVDKIHEAIYHPDEGLFARIAINKASQSEMISDVEKKVIEISTWKQQHDSAGDICEKEADELQTKIQKLENSISNILNFQNTAYSAVKWVAAAFGGAIISVIVKALYAIK